MRKNVGFFFLTKDPELSRLRALVEYLRYVSDEFVFAVDDRTDERLTQAIQTWPGAKVIPITWQDDFAWARNQALPHLKSRWTAFIDPDELPSWKLLEYISVQSLRQTERPMAYLWWTEGYFGGTNLAAQNESDWHIRMWLTGRGMFYRPVHELVMLDGRTESETRWTNLVQKAPKDAPLIHAKPAAAIQPSAELYRIIQESGKR